MKKYKLIKKYPGSPELGTIAENKSGSIRFSHNSKEWTESSTEGDLFKKRITNYPEYWLDLSKIIFTTKDEIDITDENQCLYHINDRGDLFRDKCSYLKSHNCKIAYFSREIAEEVATELRIMNKRVLSINDILNYCASQSTWKDILIPIVKERL